jgi:Flp pilus assembly protein CpaB
VASDPQVIVLVARHDLPANTMIDASLVAEQKILRSKAPDQALSASVQAIGKVTNAPLLEGQAFRKDSFVTDGSGPQLAASFAPGKRAVAISLSDAAGLDGVLYPGSIVDLILTTKGSGNAEAARSRIVLETVPVLAIERQTVLAKDAEKQDGGKSVRNNSRRVTLLVDTRQAAIVQLAMNEGTLSLAMRNPLDKTLPDRSVISLAQLMPRKESGANWMQVLAATMLQAKASNSIPRPSAPQVAAPASPDPRHAPSNNWETTIIRGGSVEKVQFPIAAEETILSREGT